MIPGSHRLGFEREELLLSGSGVCSLLQTVLGGAGMGREEEMRAKSLQTPRVPAGRAAFLCAAN